MRRRVEVPDNSNSVLPRKAGSRWNPIMLDFSDDEGEATQGKTKVYYWVRTMYMLYLCARPADKPQ